MNKTLADYADDIRKRGELNSVSVLLFEAVKDILHRLAELEEKVGK